MNIHELRFQIKDSLGRLQTKEIYTALLIVLVGFGSFGLGRLSKLEESRVPIKIENALPFSDQTASALSSDPSQKTEKRIVATEKGESGTVTEGVVSKGGKVVASKSGSKYHYPWCSGAARISEANKIWFDSIEEARKAGYTPASNCKGLK